MEGQTLLHMLAKRTHNMYDAVHLHLYEDCSCGFDLVASVVRPMYVVEAVVSTYVLSCSQPYSCVVVFSLV